MKKGLFAVVVLLYLTAPSRPVPSCPVPISRIASFMNFCELIYLSDHTELDLKGERWFGRVNFVKKKKKKKSSINAVPLRQLAS